MSENISLKRNNEEVDRENPDEETNAPDSKYIKIDAEVSEPNLENQVENKDVSESTSLEENEIKVATNENVESVAAVDNEIVTESSTVEETNKLEASTAVEIQIVTESSTVEETNKLEVSTPVEIEIVTESATVEENNKLEVSTDEPQNDCSISIKFYNNKIAELYKSKFIQFLNSFPEFRVQNDNLIINVYNKENDGKIDEISPKKRKKRSKVKKELFIVDATPSPTALKNDLRYTTKFTINTEKVVEDVVARSAKSKCFNCEDDHALKDCPHPKNHNKINEARQKFRTQNNNKGARYHLEPDQKFSHLQPGEISPKLRKALGLHKNEAPPFVYFMRQLGYPPGWLEEAKVVNSNLDMYIDGSGKSVPNVRKKGLDESKIVEYPGFNVPFQKGIRDDYRSYGVPPYSENFSKKAMIDYFQKISTHEEEDDLETCDMDIDNDPEPRNTNLEQVLESPRDSPSLRELERKKLQLLEELNEEPKKDSESDTDKEFLAVKTSCFGTPILKSNSPYSRLPNPDNFSKDVSPVINFENLPNSTGKYEQLTNVLEKVRSTMKKINPCNT